MRAEWLTRGSTTAIKRLSPNRMVVGGWEGFLLYVKACQDLSGAWNVVAEVSEESFHIPQVICWDFTWILSLLFQAKLTFFLFMGSDCQSGDRESWTEAAIILTLIHLYFVAVNLCYFSGRIKTFLQKTFALLPLQYLPENVFKMPCLWAKVWPCN